jgi:hypothetical protein
MRRRRRPGTNPAYGQPYAGAPAPAPAAPDQAPSPAAKNPALATGFIFFPKIGYVVTGSPDLNYDDSYAGDEHERRRQVRLRRGR